MTESPRPVLPTMPDTVRERVETRVFPMLRGRRRMRLLRSGGLAVAGLAIVVCTALYVNPRWAAQTKVVMNTALLGDLTSKSTPELLAMRQALVDAGPQYSASYAFVPVSQRVESSDLFVEGVVEAFEYDRESLIEQITTGTLGPLYGDVTFRVIESYPAISEKTVTVPGTIGEGFELGGRYIVPLRIEGGEFVHRYSFGIGADYTVREQGGKFVVWDLNQGDAVTVEEAWTQIRMLFDSIHGNKQGSAEKLLDLLKNHDFKEAAVALELLSVSSPSVYTEVDLVDALESHLARMKLGDPGIAGEYAPGWFDNVIRFHELTLRVLKLLYPIATEQSVERLFSIYAADRSSTSKQAFDHPDIEHQLVRLAIKFPGPRRQALVQSVLMAGATPSRSDLALIAESPGIDMELLLLDILARPETYGLSSQASVVTESAKAEFMRLREEALAKSESANVLESVISSYLNGDQRLLKAIVLRARAEDEAMLLELLQPEVPWAATFISWKVSNATVIEALKASAWEPSVGLEDVITGLARCGARDDALALVTEVLGAGLPNPDWDSLNPDFSRRAGALRALGTIGGEDAVAMVRQWRDPQLLQTCEQLQRTMEEGRGITYRYPGIGAIRLAGLMALTKLRAPEALDEWKQLYTDSTIADRMRAAVAMYYLGVVNGQDILDVFVAHEENSVPEMHRHFSTHGVTQEFQQAVNYLRSPETDKLMLERLEHGFGNGDYSTVQNLSFMLEHAHEVLPLVVDYLEDRDIATRTDVNRGLETVLGIDVGWDDEALAGAQPEKVQRWLDEVDGFLAEFEPIVTSRWAVR